jgi:hypothetical protein
MSQQMFDELKADMRAVCDARGKGLLDMRDAWAVFHAACRDRQYDDDHPGFTGGHWTRVLPFIGRRQGTDKFYDAGLHDCHIETALKKILLG